MSKDDMRHLADELYCSGAIGLPDLLLLSLHPDTHMKDWPGWDRFATLGERDGRRDWICEIQTRIAEGHADQTYLAYLERLLSLLKRVDAIRKEMQNAMRDASGANADKPSQARHVAGGSTAPALGSPCDSLAS